MGSACLRAHKDGGGVGGVVVLRTTFQGCGAEPLLEGYRRLKFNAANKMFASPLQQARGATSRKSLAPKSETCMSTHLSVPLIFHALTDTPTTTAPRSPSPYQLHSF